MTTGRIELSFIKPVLESLPSWTMAAKFLYLFMKFGHSIAWTNQHNLFNKRKEKIIISPFRSTFQTDVFAIFVFEMLSYSIIQQVVSMQCETRLWVTFLQIGMLGLVWQKIQEPLTGFGCVKQQRVNWWPTQQKIVVLQIHVTCICTLKLNKQVSNWSPQDWTGFHLQK